MTLRVHVRVSSTQKCWKTLKFWVLDLCRVPLNTIMRVILSYIDIKGIETTIFSPSKATHTQNLHIVFTPILVKNFYFLLFYQPSWSSFTTVALPKISKRRDKRTSPSKNRHLRSFMLKYKFTYIEDNSPKINFCTKSLDIWF